MYLQCIWIHESGYSLCCIYSYLEQRLNHCIYTACVCESLPVRLPLQTVSPI